MELCRGVVLTLWQVSINLNSHQKFPKRSGFAIILRNSTINFSISYPKTFNHPPKKKPTEKCNKKIKSSPGINQPTTPLHPKKTGCWVSQTVEDPPSWLPHYKNRKDPLASARVEWSKLQVDVAMSRGETVKHGFKQNTCVGKPLCVF